MPRVLTKHYGGGRPQKRRTEFPSSLEGLRANRNLFRGCKETAYVLYKEKQGDLLVQNPGLTGWWKIDSFGILDFSAF